MARKSKADIRKPEILDSFYQVLSQEGLEGASIAKIAGHMGVHPSLLIHYFKTKEEMIVELVDFMIEKYEEVYLHNIREIKDPQKRLDAILDSIFGVKWANLFDIKVFYACYYISLRNDRVYKRMKRMYDRFRELLVEEIKIYIEEGIIVDVDPERMAVLIISLVEGGNFYWTMIRDDAQIEELSRYLKEIALRFLVAGFEDN